MNTESAPRPDLTICELGYTRLWLDLVESLGLAGTAELRELSELEDLLARIRPRLVGVLRRYRIPYEEARDLMQEVYTAFLEKRATIAVPEAWLVRALRNKCIDFRREASRRLYDAVDAALLEVLAGPAPEESDRRTLLHQVSRVVARLKERCRQILALRYRLGFDREETANRLGYRHDSMRSVERRCVEALGAELTKSTRALTTSAGSA